MYQIKGNATNNWKWHFLLRCFGSNREEKINIEKSVWQGTIALGPTMQGAFVQSWASTLTSPLNARHQSNTQSDRKE